MAENDKIVAMSCLAMLSKRAINAEQGDPIIVPVSYVTLYWRTTTRHSAAQAHCYLDTPL